jgi:hypothetical protein
MGKGVGILAAHGVSDHYFLNLHATRQHSTVPARSMRLRLRRLATRCTSAGCTTLFISTRASG